MRLKSRDRRIRQRKRKNKLLMHVLINKAVSLVAIVLKRFNKKIPKAKMMMINIVDTIQNMK